MWVTGFALMKSLAAGIASCVFALIDNMGRMSVGHCAAAPIAGVFLSPVLRHSVRQRTYAACVRRYPERMMNSPRAAHRTLAMNSLLATLPGAEYRRLLRGLEPVTLTFGEILYQP